MASIARFIISHKLAAVYVLSVTVRVAYFFLFETHGGHEGAVAWMLSTGLIEDGCFCLDGAAVTFIEYPYPLFLALVRALSFDVFAVTILLQILVVSLGTALLYKLTRLLAGNDRAALFASLMYALYPYLVKQAGAATETALFSTLLIAAVYYHANARSAKGEAVSGIVFGVLILTRVAAFPIFAIALALTWMKRGTRSAAAVLVLFAVVVVPVYVWNYYAGGGVATSRLGWSLAKGNNPYSKYLIPQYNTDLLNPYLYSIVRENAPELYEGNERNLDGFYLQTATRYISDHPLESVGRWAQNFVYMFSPRLVPYYHMSAGPMRGEQRAVLTENDGLHTAVVVNASARSPLKALVHSVAYTFIALSALYGMWLRRRDVSRDALLYAALLALVVVASFFWPATRLRAPGDFALMYFSAVAVCSMFGRKG